MQVVYPTSPAPGPTDRVKFVSYPDDNTATADRALYNAQQIYELTKVNAASGTIPLDDTAIRNVLGVAIPVWQLREGDWITIPDAAAHEAAMPFYITGVDFDGGFVTLQVGGSEIVFGAAWREPDRTTHGVTRRRHRHALAYAPGHREVGR